MGRKAMVARELRFSLLMGLAVSLFVINAPLTVFFTYGGATVSVNSSSNRVLYLYEPLNDLPLDMRNKPEYAFAELKKIEIENSTIIITASNVTKSSDYSSYNAIYFIFFDIDNDNKTDVCWGYGKESRLYRYSDKAFYYNGSWHPGVYLTSAGEFGGTVVKNATKGETAFNLGGIISGKVKIKVASYAAFGAVPTKYEGDLVPGSYYVNAAKLGIGPRYSSPINDTAFPYGKFTVELKLPETPPSPPPSPPPPPPPPEEARLNFYLQLAVWAIQAVVLVKDGVLYLPFWMRDNAVYGSFIVSIFLLSSYSLVKKWRLKRQRLKKLQMPFG